MAYLAAHRSLRQANLYLIGELEDPSALWLTDYETDLLWPVWGKFKGGQPAVIKRGPVKCRFGLEVSTLDLTWSPPPASFTQSISTASPYQLAMLGFYDNWKVRVWRTLMPSPGDANTFGAYELFGGRIGDSEVTRGSIKWTVNSFLDVVNQKVPPNVIEATNTLAGYKAFTPPPGLSRIPQFNIVAPVTTTVLYLDCTFPTAHQLFPTNAFNRGFLVFNSGAGATLGGMFAPIGASAVVNVGGTNYNQVQLYTALPWPPTPGVDTCFISAAFPLNQPDGSYYGFRYVPEPEGA